MVSSATPQVRDLTSRVVREDLATEIVDFHDGRHHANDGSRKLVADVG